MAIQQPNLSSSFEEVKLHFGNEAQRPIAMRDCKGKADQGP
ncbi:hypothetical protein CCACVL1_27360 [Corchorus capsularis]|uniref:Uncharacterized protein n=1 Tax=Corchorus capsularis TaxID=210143 RepID=A0A1R3GAT2_COCAP|nr:hypothetical protein CCACVL1_27360 [Corchorus capsularis]